MNYHIVGFCFNMSQLTNIIFDLTPTFFKSNPDFHKGYFRKELYTHRIPLCNIGTIFNHKLEDFHW